MGQHSAPDPDPKEVELTGFNGEKFIVASGGVGGVVVASGGGGGGGGLYCAPNSQPTQARYPWRATIRTGFAMVVGFAPLVPVIVDASGIPAATPGVAAAVTISAGVARILAMPQVNEFLQRWAPWLAAEPKA